MVERGGTLGADDLAAYEPSVREPGARGYAGREVLTNPPPSSGGILIAFALALLDARARSDLASVVAAMEEAQAARTEEFFPGLYEDGFAERFLATERLDEAAARVRDGRRPPAPGAAGPGDRLGSTTHITAVDGDGPLRQRHLLERQRLGRHRARHRDPRQQHARRGGPEPARLPRDPAGPPGAVDDVADRRAREGELELGLGSGGSNRIRSAVLQTIIRVIADGMDAQEAVDAPRVHFEAGAVQAEPGVDEPASTCGSRRGYAVVRWDERNLFFGGVHAVARDPATGELSGGGDPRRGGAVAPRLAAVASSAEDCQGGLAMAKALLIIDFQNDFTSGGALEVPEGDEIAEPVKTTRGPLRRGRRHPRLAPAGPRLVQDPGRAVARPLRSRDARRRVPPGNGRHRARRRRRRRPGP